MKTLWLLGLLSLFSILAYSRIASAPSEAAQGPNPPITLSAPAVMQSSGDLPAGLSEYVLLHQTRDESIPVLAMAGAKACPE